jgi:hypothetical protein
LQQEKNGKESTNLYILTWLDNLCVILITLDAAFFLASSVSMILPELGAGGGAGDPLANAFFFEAGRGRSAVATAHARDFALVVGRKPVVTPS